MSPLNSVRSRVVRPAHAPGPAPPRVICPMGSFWTGHLKHVTKIVRSVISRLFWGLNLQQNLPTKCLLIFFKKTQFGRTTKGGALGRPPGQNVFIFLPFSVKIDLTDYRPFTIYPDPTPCSGSDPHRSLKSVDAKHLCMRWKNKFITR